MPVFFASELETVATYWRIFRTDGVTLAFWSHNRDMIFDGMLHLGSPGMVPSAIRLTDSLTPDSAEVTGALTHDLITEVDLEAGLYDAAQIEIGAVDWNDLNARPLYYGEFGAIENDNLKFAVELRSAKHQLERVLAPRTSPSCRAFFCDKACGLSAEKFTHLAISSSIDLNANRVLVSDVNHTLFDQGQLRFCSGPQTGLKFGIVAIEDGGFVLDQPLSLAAPQQAMIELLQGCDRTLATCRSRFANAVNFRGEPFLPGNDLLARYPRPR